MALSNRDRIDRMFQTMAPPLDDFIASVIGQGDQELGAAWTKLVALKDQKNGVPAGKEYDSLDPQVQFRILTEGNITGGFKAGWYPFNRVFGKTGESFALELQAVRNSWAHSGTFSDDDAHRYSLAWIWDRALPPLVVCMLNPSTATHENLDPTISGLI